MAQAIWAEAGIRQSSFGWKARILPELPGRISHGRHGDWDLLLPVSLHRWHRGLRLLREHGDGEGWLQQEREQAQEEEQEGQGILVHRRLSRGGVPGETLV